MKNILFIVPPHGSFDSFTPKGPGQKKNILTPPYGVLSILSYVNQDKKYDVDIFDCNRFILDNIDMVNDIKEYTKAAIWMTVRVLQPDVVCISALFNTGFSHMSIIDEIKTYSDAFICVGGGLATNLYNELFDRYQGIDAICYGEGEIPMKKLLESKGEPLHELSSAWITRESLEKEIEPQHDIVQDINEIPLIDFSCIPIERYNGRSYIEKDPDNHKIEVSIHTSRGCPFDCVFCANGKLHGKKVRMMTLDRVIETIEHYKKNYGMTILIVEDDHFLNNKERALGILKYVQENNITVEFPNGLAVYKIDNDIAKALSDAKVKVAVLAIESGSDYVLKNVINKPLTTEKIKNAVSILRQYDIRIHVFVVIGLPGEMDEHREETLEFLIDLDIDWAYIFIGTPIVGSRLFEICKENDYLIDDSYDDHVVSKCNIKAPGIDPEKIEEYAYYMNIMVNFIYNSNVMQGKYEVAREYFQNVVRSYPKQAIAHYMLSKIAEDEMARVSYLTLYQMCYEEHLGGYKDSKAWKELIKSLEEENGI